MVGTGRSPRRVSPRCLRWTGAGGALALALAAWAPHVVDRMPPAGAVLALAGAVAGTGVLVLAWVLLGVRGTDGSWPPPAWLVRTAVLWGAPLLLAPPLFSDDVFSYLAQGEIAARGLDPGAVSPLDALGAPAVAAVGPRWRDSVSPYGPAFTALERVIAQVSAGDPVVGVALHRAVALLAAGLIGWSVLRLAGRTGVPPSSALWWAVCSPLLLLHALAGAHNDALMVGLVLTGTVLALGAVQRPARWPVLLLGVLLVVLAAAVKVPALLALVVIGTAWARGRGGELRHLAAAGAGVLAVTVGGFAALQALAGVGPDWLVALRVPGHLASWLAPTNWPGFVVALITGSDDSPAAQAVLAAGRAVGVVLLGCGVVAVVVQAVRGRVGDVGALAALFTLLVVLGPVVQPWYFLWALGPLACCLLTARVRVALGVTVAVVSVVVPPWGGDYSGRISEVVTAYALALAVVGAVLAGLRRRGSAAASRSPQQEEDACSKVCVVEKNS